MKFEEINNLDLQNTYFKIGKTSITVKDNNDKTKGVITGIENFEEMQFNKRVDWNIKFKQKGIKNIPFNRNLILYKEKLYYLFDIDHYDNLIESINRAWEEGYKRQLEKEKLKLDKLIIEAESNDIKVFKLKIN